MRLAGKIAVVIGAGQGPGTGMGNGRATVIRFAQEGAKVLAVDRDLTSAEETAGVGCPYRTTACPLLTNIAGPCPSWNWNGAPPTRRKTRANRSRSHFGPPSSPDMYGLPAPRRPGAVYGEEYRAADAQAVVDALATGADIPPPPNY